MTNKQNAWDVVVRATKTALAAYAAFLAAGGFNVIHISTTTQVKLAGLAAATSAILNIALKVHTAITAPVTTATTSTTTTVTPTTTLTS